MSHMVFIFYWKKRLLIDFQKLYWAGTKLGRDLDTICTRPGIIPRRAAALGRLTAPLLPWPGNFCSSTDIHTRTAAILMTLQTQTCHLFKVIFKRRLHHTHAQLVP